jgi:hypothetical protein
MRTSRQPDAAETPAVATSAAPAVNFPRAVLEHWKKVAHAVGVVQTRLLMIVFYFIAVLPLGLLMRMSDDKLRLRPPKGSAWVPHKTEEPSLEMARRQF